ncbi:MAG: hypothetical protein KDB32_10310 [Planctomycetes bacterium]|nr:hypothetical protein [Planctomycetota bacterium]MCA8946353.1 hypothetical protein [Planctomycetota bacterium]
MFRWLIRAIRGEFAVSPDIVIGPDSPLNSPFRDLYERLREKGVKFSPGLSNSDINNRFGFPIPPDLREFWSTVFPVGKRWWDWRDRNWSRRDMAERVADELQFNVESGDIWLESWGPRPRHKAEARGVVVEWATKGPFLLPLFGHRFAVCEPVLPNTPVLSIYGSDWIYYGWNIASWLEQEFLGRDLFNEQPWPPHQSIGQWQEVLDFGCPELDEHGNLIAPVPELPPTDWLD